MAHWQKVAGSANTWNIHDHSHKEKSHDKIRQNPNTKPKSRKDTESLSQNHTQKSQTQKELPHNRPP